MKDGKRTVACRRAFCTPIEKFGQRVQHLCVFVRAQNVVNASFQVGSLFCFGHGTGHQNDVGVRQLFVQIGYFEQVLSAVMAFVQQRCGVQVARVSHRLYCLLAGRYAVQFAMPQRTEVACCNWVGSDIYI